MADEFRAKFAGLDHEPLFDVATSRQREARPRRTRNVDRRQCPECGQKVGIVAGAMRGYKPVLTWRRHWRTTRSGAVFPCSASETEVTDP